MQKLKKFRKKGKTFDIEFKKKKKTLKSKKGLSPAKKSSKVSYKDYLEQE